MAAPVSHPQDPHFRRPTAPQVLLTDYANGRRQESAWQRLAKTGLGLDSIGALVIATIVYTIAVPVFRVSLATLPAWVR